jgi:hypothetical protein
MLVRILRIKGDFSLRLCFRLYQFGMQTVGKRQGKRQTVSNRQRKNVMQKTDRVTGGRQQEVNRKRKGQAARRQAQSRRQASRQAAGKQTGGREAGRRQESRQRQESIQAAGGRQAEVNKRQAFRKAEK